MIFLSRRFKRVHDRGTESFLTKHVDGWRIRLHLREDNHIPVTIAGYLRPTLEAAKRFANAELLKLGHVCSASCQGWRGC
jgi:hypothetical protein